MANETSGTLWKLDTTGVITTGPVCIKNMWWDEPTAAAHDLTVLDGEGNTIWDVDARNFGNGVVEPWYGGTDSGTWYNGFNFSVKDSGTLYVQTA